MATTGSVQGNIVGLYIDDANADVDGSNYLDFDLSSRIITLGLN